MFEKLTWSLPPSTYQSSPHSNSGPHRTSSSPWDSSTERTFGCLSFYAVIRKSHILQNSSGFISSCTYLTMQCRNMRLNDYSSLTHPHQPEKLCKLGCSTAYKNTYFNFNPSFIHIFATAYVSSCCWCITVFLLLLESRIHCIIWYNQINRFKSSADFNPPFVSKYESIYLCDEIY